MGAYLIHFDARFTGYVNEYGDRLHFAGRSGQVAKRVRAVMRGEGPLKTRAAHAQGVGMSHTATIEDEDRLSEVQADPERFCSFCRPSA